MADFLTAYKKVLQHEGGYVNDPQDPGGETYKGVARKIHSKWEGWAIIDLYRHKPNFPANLDTVVELQEKIQQFYERNFWDKIQGDNITSENVAISIFDFAVNAGVTTSISIVQMVVGAEPDGVVGPLTVTTLNSYNEELFLALFTIAKIARYITIVKKRPSSQKYFYGWVRRALGAQ